MAQTNPNGKFGYPRLSVDRDTIRKPLRRQECRIDTTRVGNCEKTTAAVKTGLPKYPHRQVTTA